MSNPLDIANLITEYGILVLIASVFLSYVSVLFKRQNERAAELEKKQQSIYDQQIKDNRKMFELFLEEVRKNKTTHTVDDEERTEKIEKKINSSLKELLYSTNSGRAYLIRYHNGMHDLSNNSFLKMSMTNEITRQGVSSAIRNFTNQFRSLFPWMIDEIAKGPAVHIDDLNIVKTIEHGLYQYLFINNITRLHAIRIKNSDGKVIGFVAISYLTNELYLENEKIGELLVAAQLKIEAILNANE